MAAEKLILKEPPWQRPWRWLKTLFFLISMLLSLLLVCAPPLFVVLLDLLLPPALLSAFLRGATGTRPAFAPHFKSFDFVSSLVDLPIISAARSILILCAYGVCGGRGAYAWTATASSTVTAAYVVLKLVAMFVNVRVGNHVGRMVGVSPNADDTARIVAMDALFVTSLLLAIAHVIAACQASHRERRRLLVYRIDIEAVKLQASPHPKLLKQASL